MRPILGGLPARPKTPHLCSIYLPPTQDIARQTLGWPDISPSASFLSFYYANFHASPSPWRTWKSLHVFCWKKCLVNHWGNTWFQVIAGTLPNCSSSPTVRKLAIAREALDTTISNAKDGTIHSMKNFLYRLFRSSSAVEKNMFCVGVSVRGRVISFYATKKHCFFL